MIFDAAMIVGSLDRDPGMNWKIDRVPKISTYLQH